VRALRRRVVARRRGGDSPLDLEGDRRGLFGERQGPHVSAPQRRVFGSVVVQEMAERSMDGKVDLEYAPSGVTWRLTCPAGNAPGAPVNVSAVRDIAEFDLPMRTLGLWWGNPR